MTKRLFVAALTLPLAFASPAIAAGPTDQKSLNSMGGAAASVVEASTATKPPKTYIREPGYRGGKDTIVRRWPVSSDASIDLGVFAIPRYSAKEPSLRKFEPMRAVNGNSQHIPAVSFSFRF